MISTNGIINGILCCLNPRFNLCNNHYVCGTDLILFTSIAQVENCLTGITSKCKALPENITRALEESKKQ